jgi:hypothetical protein
MNNLLIWPDYNHLFRRTAFSVAGQFADEMAVRRVADQQSTGPETLRRHSEIEHARKLIDKGEAQYVADVLNVGRSMPYRALVH